jgi:hypothetical protein
MHERSWSLKIPSVELYVREIVEKLQSSSLSPVRDDVRSKVRSAPFGRGVVMRMDAFSSVSTSSSSHFSLVLQITASGDCW